MKKIIAALLTLCLVTVVVPPISDENNNADLGISTYAYSLQNHVN